MPGVLAVVLTKHIQSLRFSACQCKKENLKKMEPHRFSGNYCVTIGSLVCMWMSETAFRSPTKCVLGI